MFWTVFSAWLILLFILRYLKLNFFVFLVGSVGLFTIMIYLGLHKVDKVLSYIVILISSYIERIMNIYDTYLENQIIVVYYKKQAISFFVDYECSGFIEILVYISLLWFYPVYSVFKKSIYTVLGVSYIITANILRVLLIIVGIYFFGVQTFFWIHSVLARIFFFVLVVICYYYVFTRPHITKQKVGELTPNVIK